MKNELHFGSAASVDEEADSQNHTFQKSQPLPPQQLTKEEFEEKKSKDAATSHLRKQAFQRAIIRNGGNFDGIEY